VTAELLGSSDRPEMALAELDRIRNDDSLASAARADRLQLLTRLNRTDEAVAEAEKSSRQRGATIDDWVRLGDLYTQLSRHSDASTAYSNALDLAKQDPEAKERLWSLYLLQGGALEQSGNWPQAKVALEQSVSLAPDQPVALNYLGYSKLEHHEDLAGAQKLIEKALALRPDDAAITDSLGWAYYLRGNLPDAIEQLERAAAGQPGETSINEHLGDAYWAAGRRLDARFSWRAALVHADKDEADRINRKIAYGIEKSEIAHQ
jgi:Flp pilus assembly protein TadD